MSRFFVRPESSSVVRPVSRTVLRIGIALMVVALASPFAPSARAAANPNAEPQDMEVDLLAKLAKERSKANAERSADKAGQQRTPGQDAGGASDGCGNVGIGNVFTGGAPGFQPPREITVIVTGDIISANNRCR
jgi:hypothetical protein